MVITLKNENYENKVCKHVIGFDPIKCECKTVIMCNLQSGGKNLFALQKLMDGVSYDIMTLKLNQLEEIGLVFKRVSYSYPAQINYFLTIKGWECVRSLRNYVDVDAIAV